VIAERVDMRVLPKQLASLAALGVIAAAVAVVCARGLQFSDVTPAALHQAVSAAVEPPAAAPPATPATVQAPVPPPAPEQARLADTAGQLVDGLRGSPRPDGGRSVAIPEITPDQADAAARTATDLINSLLANGGERRIGAQRQINPDEASAMAQSAAKMLNGFLRDNRFVDEERPHRRTR
jgi:hypothetical protein